MQTDVRTTYTPDSERRTKKNVVSAQTRQSANSCAGLRSAARDHGATRLFEAPFVLEHNLIASAYGAAHVLQTTLPQFLGA